MYIRKRHTTLMRYIELLSPARDLECGIAAVDHGADAVYIGAPRFGARAAAGNSVEDIQKLCDYAHQFGVKIYVTLNTLLRPEELEPARLIAWDLYHAGVDAFITQDEALLRLALPPVPLHASTQMDNRTKQDVARLKKLGFNQVVLARELSLEQIREIHEAVPDMMLEAFVHGALCVSYSGRCYASEYCFGRSANRGECAQFCRLPFSLEDANGNTLIKDKYLLSLKDMNRQKYLEEMLDAGVRSFKIEGRLKDIAYVKNVTAAYREALLWHKHLHLPARPLAQLLARLHRLLPLRPHKRPRFARYAQKPRPRSWARKGSQARLHNCLIHRCFQQWRRALLLRRGRQFARLPRESCRRKPPVF